MQKFIMFCFDSCSQTRSSKISKDQVRFAHCGKVFVVQEKVYLDLAEPQLKEWG